MEASLARLYGHCWNQLWPMMWHDCRQIAIYEQRPERNCATNCCNWHIKHRPYKLSASWQLHGNICFLKQSTPNVASLLQSQDTNTTTKAAATATATTTANANANGLKYGQWNFYRFSKDSRSPHKKCATKLNAFHNFRSQVKVGIPAMVGSMHLEKTSKIINNLYKYTNQSEIWTKK